MSSTGPGLDFPNVVSGSTLGAGFGKGSYPVYAASVGVPGMGKHYVSVSACNEGRADMAEDLIHHAWEME